MPRFICVALAVLLAYAATAAGSPEPGHEAGPQRQWRAMQAVPPVYKGLHELHPLHDPGQRARRGQAAQEAAHAVAMATARQARPQAASASAARQAQEDAGEPAGAGAESRGADGARGAAEHWRGRVQRRLTTTHDDGSTTAITYTAEPVRPLCARRRQPLLLLADTCVLVSRRRSGCCRWRWRRASSPLSATPAACA